jgi:hypothetical protein
MSFGIDSKYSVELVDQTGLTVADITGLADNRKLTFIRNGSYEAEFSIDLDSLEKIGRATNVNPRSMLSTGRYDCVIKRLGIPLFAGRVVFDGSDFGEMVKETVKIDGWFNLFKDRYTSISRLFTSVDAGQIAWTLISESQALTYGTLGITQGTITASQTRTRLYEFKNIRDALVQLSEVQNGIDFEFTPDKVFNVFYPSMGVDRTELEFTYPGNIKGLSITTDATQLKNYIIARGQGFGEGQMYDVRQDTASQETYGLRQAVVDYSDIPDITTLQNLADEQLSHEKDPIEILQVTLDGNIEPYVGSYWLGDRVMVTIEGYERYNHIIRTPYRIDEISISIDEFDNESVALKLTVV